MKTAPRPLERAHFDACRLPARTAILSTQTGQPPLSIRMVLRDAPSRHLLTRETASQAPASDRYLFAAHVDVHRIQRIVAGSEIAPEPGFVTEAGIQLGSGAHHLIIKRLVDRRVLTSRSLMLVLRGWVIGQHLACIQVEDNKVERRSAPCSWLTCMILSASAISKTACGAIDFDTVLSVQVLKYAGGCGARMQQLGINQWIAVSIIEAAAARIPRRPKCPNLVRGKQRAARQE